MIYSIFMFKLMNIRVKDDVSASAASYLLNKQIPTSQINGGLGFNHYHNYDYIIDLYKNVDTKYPINWTKFHHMANYFRSEHQNVWGIVGKREITFWI